MDVAINENEMNFEAPLVVSKIFHNCLYSGFFGRLDSERIKLITERMLEAVESIDCDFIIIDMSNIDLIDSAIAAHLMRISRSLKFSGVQVVLCGIKGFVAQTMSVVDIQLNEFMIAKDLMKSLEIVYEASGYRLTRE